jgi:hypothetical protein
MGNVINAYAVCPYRAHNGGHTRCAPATHKKSSLFGDEEAALSKGKYYSGMEPFIRGPLLFGA